MATIDKLDLSVYSLYAVRTKMLEDINAQYRFQEASSIPPQTQVINVLPKLTELDLLLGIVPVCTPWALFLPPKKFRELRRSPFAFSQIAPSLGSAEKQFEDEGKLQSIQCNTPQEAEERDVLLACFKQLGKINEWLGHIVGRVGQFLQG